MPLSAAILNQRCTMRIILSKIWCKIEACTNLEGNHELPNRFTPISTA
jgi:hypothetical protein